MTTKTPFVKDPRNFSSGLGFAGLGLVLLAVAETVCKWVGGTAHSYECTTVGGVQEQTHNTKLMVKCFVSQTLNDGQTPIFWFSMLFLVVGGGLAVLSMLTYPSNTPRRR